MDRILTKPMPGSKKKEIMAKILLTSALNNRVSDEMVFVPSVRTIPINEVSDESEESLDADYSTDHSDNHDVEEMNMPESVNVDEFGDDEMQEGDCNTGDALEGADLFKDVYVEPEPEYATNSAADDDGDEDQSLPVAKELSSDDTESSVDLVDIELQLSAEERRSIRRKKKRERKEAKQKLILLEKQRKAELEQAKKQRFFDKSRFIPNDVYFGDVVVPLHVLHSYGKNTKRETSAKSPPVAKAKPRAAPVRRPRASSITNCRIERLKNYLRAAGVRQREYKPVIQSCATELEVRNELMKILRNHGLEGDPTMAKCRELKLKNRLPDDVEAEDLELDTSVIINPTGRTLRSGTTIAMPQDDDSLDSISPTEGGSCANNGAPLLGPTGVETAGETSVVDPSSAP